MLGAVALGNLVVAALHFGLAAAGPAVRSSLSLDTGMLGVVLATPAIGLMLGTYGWGLLADATSERRVLTGAFVGFAVANLAAAHAARGDATIGFGFAMLASGLFGSAAHSAGGRAISAAFPAERHGLVLSIRHVAIPIGAALGGMLVPLLVRRDGLAPTMTWFAATGVVAAIVLTIAIPSSRGAGRVVAGGARGVSPTRLVTMWLLAIGAGSLAFVQLGIGSFLTVQLVDRAGLQLAVAAVVFAIAQLAGGAGRVILGVWSDRAGDRVRVLQHVSASAFVLVVAALAIGQARWSVAIQAIALVVVTSCNGVVVAVAASLAPPGRTGATLGMQTTANAAACAVAPILLGGVIQRVGWHAYDAALAVVLVVSSVALVRLRAISSSARPASSTSPAAL